MKTFKLSELGGQIVIPINLHKDLNNRKCLVKRKLRTLSNAFLISSIDMHFYLERADTTEITCYTEKYYPEMFL